MQKLNGNNILNSFLRTKKSKNISKYYRNVGKKNAVRLRYVNEDDPEREGFLLILKQAKFESGELQEKGVLHLKYNNSIFEFTTIFELEKLYSHY